MKIRLHAMIEEEQMELLKRLSKKNDLTLGEVVRKVLEFYSEELDKRKSIIEKQNI